MKFSLSIFIVGVLLGATTSDFLCILQQLIVVTPDHFFSSPASACRDIDTKFYQVRKDLKKCTRHEIDTNLLESLHKDFCTPNSDYRRKFDSTERCLSSNIPNLKSCLEHMSISPGILLEGSMKDMCIRLSIETSNCLTDKVGSPCGSTGLEVYERISKASEPFFAGICLVAAGVQVEDSETEDGVVETESETENEIANFDDEVTEEGVVEAGVAEGRVVEGATHDVKCDKSASSAANYVFLWCLLLGVLLAVMW